MSLSLAFLTAKFLFLFSHDSFPHSPGSCLQSSTLLTRIFAIASEWAVLPLTCAFVSLFEVWLFFFFPSELSNCSVVRTPELTAGLPNMDAAFLIGQVPIPQPSTAILHAGLACPCRASLAKGAPVCVAWGESPAPSLSDAPTHFCSNTEDLLLA